MRNLTESEFLFIYGGYAEQDTALNFAAFSSMGAIIGGALGYLYGSSVPVLNPLGWAALGGIVGFFGGGFHGIGRTIDSEQI